MNRQKTKCTFLESVVNWTCDSYSLSIHYLAAIEGTRVKIIDALLICQPVEPTRIDNFAVKAGSLLAGRQVFPGMKKAELIDRLSKATVGTIHANGLELVLPCDVELDYYQEIPNGGTGFSELNLRVIGARLPGSGSSESVVVDNQLRVATPPFDGLADLCSWLMLKDLRVSGQSSSISIRVGPPVDLLFEETLVSSNMLTLTLISHPKFASANIRLTVREFPGVGLDSRRHITDMITWGRAVKGQKKGTVNLRLLNANSLLAMLVVGGHTVRRRWFDDPEKAINSRYVATQVFDKDLKQLRLALFDSTDSVRFEKAVASLLFLLGFSAAVQVETDAPDVLVATPEGKLALIECTTKIADFHSKLGKLVDRCNALKAKLNSTGHNSEVAAFLVCGLPKSQIATHENQLRQNKVTLLCRDDLTAAFEQIRAPASPDKLLNQAVEAFASAPRPI